MCAKRLILHVGQPKAGTSTLQRFFKENRALLCEAGYDYPPLEDWNAQIPNPHMVSSGNGNLLAVALRAQFRAEEFPPDLRWENARKTLFDIIRDCPEPNLILSHEDLISIHPDNLVPLFRDLDEIGIAYQVVMYLRDQVSWLASDYQQHIKQYQASLTIEERVADRLEVCDLKRICQKWENLVGRDRLTVRLLDRRCMRHNIVYDFFHGLGDPQEALRDARVPSSNEGLNRGAVELLRTANAMNLKPDLYRRVAVAAQHMTAEAPGDRFRLPASLAKFVAHYYRASNDHVATHFLDPDAAATLRAMTADPDGADTSGTDHLVALTLVKATYDQFAGKFDEVMERLGD